MISSVLIICTTILISKGKCFDVPVGAMLIVTGAIDAALFSISLGG